MSSAHAYFDKALALDETLYQAHQGKGMVFLDQDENRCHAGRICHWPRRVP